VASRGLIFTGESIRAILAGAKTQTRRIVKPQPGTDVEPVLRYNRPEWPCPYGSPGTRSWARESIKLLARAGRRDLAVYVADDSAVLCLTAWPWKVSKLSPIFMPYGCRRLDLVITAVRAQRLHEITEADALAEGVGVAYRQDGPGTFARDSARAAYEIAWGEINGPHSWAMNPFVWALTFEAARRDD